MVIDFVYRCIQPLKDRIYLACLYVGASDPTRETAGSMTEDNVKARVELILRGEAHNEGTPKPYSAWNPTPTVSNLTVISLSILVHNHILIHEITAEQHIQVSVRPDNLWSCRAIKATIRVIH